MLLGWLVCEDIPDELINALLQHSCAFRTDITTPQQDDFSIDMTLPLVTQVTPIPQESFQHPIVIVYLSTNRNITALKNKSQALFQNDFVDQHCLEYTVSFQQQWRSDFYLQSIDDIPNMMNHLQGQLAAYLQATWLQLHEDVGVLRRGITGRFLSTTKRFWKTSQPCPSPTDRLARRLADIAYFLGDHAYALPLYESLERDYTNANALDYAAHCEEIILLIKRPFHLAPKHFVHHQVPHRYIRSLLNIRVFPTLSLMDKADWSIAYPLATPRLQAMIAHQLQQPIQTDLPTWLLWHMPMEQVDPHALIHSDMTETQFEQLLPHLNTLSLPIQCTFSNGFWSYNAPIPGHNTINIWLYNPFSFSLSLQVLVNGTLWGSTCIDAHNKASVSHSMTIEAWQIDQLQVIVLEHTLSVPVDLHCAPIPIQLPPPIQWPTSLVQHEYKEIPYPSVKIQGALWRDGHLVLHPKDTTLSIRLEILDNGQLAWHETEIDIISKPLPWCYRLGPHCLYTVCDAIDFEGSYTYKDHVIIAYNSGTMTIHFGPQTVFMDMTAHTTKRLQGVGDIRQCKDTLPMSSHYTQVGDTVVLHKRGWIGQVFYE